METTIFLSAPDVREYERDYVMAAIDSNWLAPAGPDLNQFEQDLAVATGRKHAVGLSSGTAAIHLALLEMGVKPGDEVICSTLTFVGSANPIVYCGATPIFIDSEPQGWNMDPNLLADELAERAASNSLPAAAVVVDLYGNCARYDQIEAILKEYEVPILEDAAEALGSTFLGRPGGSFGDHAILSFNGNKIITSSGGGALVTDDETMAARIRHLSTQARETAPHYEHVEIGFNYRLSNLCAALGRAQLKTLEQRIVRRKEIHEAYAALLDPIGGVDVLRPAVGSTSNYWLTCATLDQKSSPSTRDAVIAHLASGGIESRPVWKPMHMQPVFGNAASRVNGTSERLFETGICLPSGSGMSEQDLARVVDAIAEAMVKT